MNNGLVEDQLVIFFKLGLYITLIVILSYTACKLTCSSLNEGCSYSKLCWEGLNMVAFKAESHLIQRVAMAVYKLYNYVNLVQLVKSGNNKA